MQRFIFGIVFFSFCMLSFSATCMAFSKYKNQVGMEIAEENDVEEENEKEDKDDKEVFSADFCSLKSAFDVKDLNRFYFPLLNLPKQAVVLEIDPPENF